MLRCGTDGTRRITLPEPQWYVAKHRHQIGPMPEAKIVRNIHTGSADPTVLVFMPGCRTGAGADSIDQAADGRSQTG